MVQLIPESYTVHLDLLKIFERDAPLHVDLGCGDGTFLFALAQRYPEKNFLGIERLSGRVEKASRKAAKIDNMRVLNVETSYAVRYLLPEQSVETFYLLFPDPWPKRRHHRRRIVTPDFLNSIHASLEENGVLRIAMPVRLGPIFRFRNSRENFERKARRFIDCRCENFRRSHRRSPSIRARRSGVRLRRFHPGERV